jgi:HlyD family secretion protein
MAARARIVVPVLILVVVLVWAGLTFFRRAGDQENGVVASGTIEATQVSAASKIPGRIVRIHASEGDDVRTGDPLVTLDGREVAAQIDQGRAGVEAARARVLQARAALALQIRQVDAQVAQARAAADVARERVGQAGETQTLTAGQSAQAVRQAEAALAASRNSSAAARAAVERARRDLVRIEALFRDGAVSAQQVDAGRAASTTAQAQYDASLDMIAQAEATLRLARENQRQVEIRERDVRAARSQVRQAEANVALARAGEEMIAQRRADLAAAEAAVAQAEAGLRVLLTQQQNLIVASPLTGVVLAELARAGEVVAVGAPILTIADLHEVWIKLYIPLPKLGQIALGQRATVTTDALPGRTFTGTVTEVSQQAEFTPRNVQTPQERVKLVFAVKVTLPNPERLLKPGMPADAVILTEGTAP